MLFFSAYLPLAWYHVVPNGELRIENSINLSITTTVSCQAENIRLEGLKQQRPRKRESEGFATQFYRLKRIEWKTNAKHDQ